MKNRSPDYTLIRYNVADDSNYASQTMLFSAGDGSKALCFVAAQHGGHRPTLDAVSSAFEQFKPTVVIVEGMPNRGEESPAWFADFARKKRGATGSETLHAVNLALDRGISFVAGEPTSLQVYKNLQEHGYGLNDYIAWDVSRNLYSDTRQGLITESNVSERIEAIARAATTSIGIDNHPYTSNDYKEWFGDRLGRHFSLANMQNTDDHPRIDVNANFMQRLIADADRAREPNILATIDRQLEKHDRVLVVYGASHLWKLEPALENLLGPADSIPAAPSRLVTPRYRRETYDP